MVESPPSLMSLPNDTLEKIFEHVDEQYVFRPSTLTDSDAFASTCRTLYEMRLQRQPWLCLARYLRAAHRYTDDPWNSPASLKARKMLYHIHGNEVVHAWGGIDQLLCLHLIVTSPRSSDQPPLHLLMGPERSLVRDPSKHAVRGVSKNTKTKGGGLATAFFAASVFHKTNILQTLINLCPDQSLNDLIVPESLDQLLMLSERPDTRYLCCTCDLCRSYRRIEERIFDIIHSTGLSKYLNRATCVRFFLLGRPETALKLLDVVHHSTGQITNESERVEERMRWISCKSFRSGDTVLTWTCEMTMLRETETILSLPDVALEKWVGFTNNLGDTALIIACRNGPDYADIALRLLDIKGCERWINAKNVNGITALIEACANSTEGVAMRILDVYGIGGKEEKKSRYAVTPCLTAFRQNHPRGAAQKSSSITKKNNGFKRGGGGGETSQSHPHTKEKVKKEAVTIVIKRKEELCEALSRANKRSTAMTNVCRRLKNIIS